MQGNTARQGQTQGQHIIDNVADAERSGAVLDALFELIVCDARTWAAYAAWRNDSDDDASFAAAAEFVDRLNLRKYAALLLPLLLQQWKLWAASEALGQPLQRLQFTARRQPALDRGLPIGRRPKTGQEDISRNVRWFYRSRVKHPAESIRSLAREYHSGQASSESRALVQNAIKRVTRLLDCIAR